MKPIPKPVYPCKCCAADYSWPSDDLFWSDHDQGWFCDMCWDDRDIEEDKGICLADEIEKAQAEHDAEVRRNIMDDLTIQIETEFDEFHPIVERVVELSKQLRQEAQEKTDAY